jgi:hypothetical protein
VLSFQGKLQDHKILQGFVDNLIELYDPRIGSYTKYWAGEVNLIINFIGITDFYIFLGMGLQSSILFFY